METSRSTKRYSSSVDAPPPRTARKLAGIDVVLSTDAPDPALPPAVDMDDVVALSERLLPLARKHPRFERDRLECKCREPFRL